MNIKEKRHKKPMKMSADLRAYLKACPKLSRADLEELGDAVRAVLKKQKPSISAEFFAGRSARSIARSRGIPLSRVEAAIRAKLRLTPTAVGRSKKRKNTLG